MRIDPNDLDRPALYRLMISVVVPRPIAWVSTVDAAGVANAAPYSYFQALSSQPPFVMIAVGDRRSGAAKDTRANLEATGEFVVNVVGEESGWRMVQTAVDHPPGVSEFDEVGLEAAPSERVRPPRIAECAVSLECKVDRTLKIGTSTVCIGEVVLFHVRDDVLAEDRTVDPAKLRPLGRLGGSCYAPLREVATITATEAPATVVSDLADMWRRLRDRRRAVPESPEVADALARLAARDAELEAAARASGEAARVRLRRAIEEEAYVLGWMSARLGRDL